jgi:hypothetical protein
MKKTMLRIALPLACLVALASGCIYDSLHTRAVLCDKVVVNFTQNLTSPNLLSSAVSDQFRTKLLDALAAQHASLQDVESITMVSGAYKVAMPSKASHDWTITGTVTIARQDDPNGPVTEGPANFIDLLNQSLKVAQRMPVKANLDAAGVGIVNNALADLLNGVNPRLVITLQSSDITPAPSVSDPLMFGWLAEVTFQAVVHLHSGDHH